VLGRLPNQIRHSPNPFSQTLYFIEILSTLSTA
jgi:hypothetical protein